MFADTDVPTVAGFLKPLAKQSSDTKIEMDSGLGAGVYDILNQENDPWDPTMQLTPLYMGAGTTAMDITGTFRFANIRAAAWWHMRELLDPNGIHNIALPDDDMLLGDLVAPKYEYKYYHQYLTVFVEPKENLKKASRLGRSTDYGDAVVIAFWDNIGGGGGIVF